MHHLRFSSFGSIPVQNSRAGAAPCGQALDALADSEGLRDRFFAWRGVSGRRYVCSVFQSGEDAFVADVTDGAVIGVAREGARTRPVCVFLAQDRRRDGRRSLRRLAQEHGIVEWHVHFCADAETLRELASVVWTAPRGF